MHLKRQHLFFRLPKILVLLLFMPLFFVQGFFNYDSFQNYSNGSGDAGVAKQTANTGNAGTVKFSTGKSATRHFSIRLNKRFQPESTPCIVNVFIEVPLHLPVINTFCTYADPFLTSPQFCKYKLRGPPAVA